MGELVVSSGGRARAALASLRTACPNVVRGLRRWIAARITILTSDAAAAQLERYGDIHDDKDSDQCSHFHLAIVLSAPSTK